MKKNFVLVRFEQMGDELGDYRTRQVLAVSEDDQKLSKFCLKEYGVSSIPIPALGLPSRNRDEYLKDNFYYSVEESEIKII
jgi:hypothetical protein